MRILKATWLISGFLLLFWPTSYILCKSHANGNITAGPLLLRLFHYSTVLTLLAIPPTWIAGLALYIFESKSKHRSSRLRLYALIPFTLIGIHLSLWIVFFNAEQWVYDIRSIISELKNDLPPPSKYAKLDFSTPDIAVVNTASISGIRAVKKVAWSPDGGLLATLQDGKAEKQVIVYDTNSLKPIQSLFVKHSAFYDDKACPDDGGSISFSPDGRLLAAGFGILTLWDTKTWKSARDIEGPFSRGIYIAHAVDSAGFTTDGKQLTVRYKNVTWPEDLKATTREEGGKFNNDHFTKRPSSIMSFDVETGNRLFVHNEDDAKFSENETEEIRYIWKGPISHMQNGQYLISAHYSIRNHQPERNSLDFRDPRTGVIAKSLDLPNHNIKSKIINDFSINSNTNQIATHSYAEDVVRIWDIDSGDQVMEIAPVSAQRAHLAYALDGKLLITIQYFAQRDYLCFWGVDSGILLKKVKTSGEQFKLVNDVAVSPNGRRIAVAVGNQIEITSLK